MKFFSNFQWAMTFPAFLLLACLLPTLGALGLGEEVETVEVLGDKYRLGLRV